MSFNEAEGGFHLLLTPEQYLRILKAVTGRCAAVGLSARWLAGDTAHADTLVHYARPVLIDAAVAPHLAALSFHTWDVPLVTDGLLGEISSLAQAHDLPVWACEVGYHSQLHLGDPAVFASWSNAWLLGKTCHRVLVHAQASILDLWSYQGEYPLAANGVLHPSGKVIRQLADGLPSGTRRTQALSDDLGVWALGAAHRERNHTSLTLVNTYGLPVTVTVNGLPRLPSAVVRSDATAQNTPVGSLTPSATGLSLVLAAQSITTLTSTLGFDPANQAPVVNAGADQSVALPAVATLVASVSDDGLPAGESLTTTWSTVSGPGTVTFGNAQALGTVASFSQSGTFVLRLSAFDGLATSADDLTITVTGGDTGIPPLVAFASPTSNHGESDGMVSVAVVLDHASSGSVSVTYELVPASTAIPGVDCGPLGGSVTFAPGETTKTISVALINDALDEDDESLIIRLVLASGATIGPVAQHDLTIVDDDAMPVAAFTQASSSVDEAVGGIDLVVALSAVSGRAITVSYAIAGGTARGPGDAPSDHLLAPGSLSFAAGETTKQIRVNVVNDGLNEIDETVDLALTVAVHALVSPDHHVLTISDNDPQPPVSFFNSQVTVDEHVGIASVLVNIPAPSGRDITVHYAVPVGPAGGDAVNGATAPGADADFTLAPGMVTIPAGSVSATILVAITDDLRNEALESLKIDITALDGGVLGAVQRTDVLIRDNDPLPSVSFGVPAPVVAESASTVTVPLLLSAVSGRVVTVTYQAAAESGPDVAINGDPAVAGTDVQVTPGQVTFAPGVTTATIVFPVVDDALPELSEHVTLVLSAPVSATLGAPSSQAVVITDNDGPVGLIAVAASSLQVAEAVGAAVVTVTANQLLGQDVQVHFIVSGGTAVIGDPAVAGTDVGIAFGDVVIPAGSTSATIAVPIVDDALTEVAETAIVTLTQVTAVGGGPLVGIYLGTPAATTLTIIDNDLPQLAFAADIIETDEGAAEQVAITVTLSRISDQQVDVQLAVDGSATAGTDYVIAPTSLVFSPGTTVATAVVSVIGDATPESDETVTLTLVNPVGAMITSPTPAILYITNDDLPAPVIEYAYSSPTGVDIYGAVPSGFGVSGIQVVIVEPNVITSATGEILGQVFHVHVDNNPATPSSGVALSLRFNDDRTPTHLSPATAATLPFGDGQGGDTTTGSPTTLPPVTPRVTVSIIGGLTGDETGTLNDEAVHFTNQTAGSVKVRVTASASPSTITSVTLYLDNGQSFDLPVGSSVTKDLPSLSDGRYVLSASATAANSAGETATGSTSTSSQKVLIVDTTRPVFRYILAAEYRPAGFNLATDPIPLMRTSLSEDVDLVLLNKNGETGSGGAPGNKSLRFDRSMNVFAKSDFTVLAEIDDLSGLSDSDRQTRVEYKPQDNQTSYRSGFTMTVIPPVASTPAQPTDHGQRFSLSGLGTLPESVKVNRETMKVITHMGRYTVQIQGRDRAGNQLKDGGYADQFKLWIDTMEPWAIVGTLGREPKDDRETVISPVRFIYTNFDVAEAWQDTIDEQHRMLRLQPTAIASSYGVDTRSLALWRLKTSQVIAEGSSGSVNVHLMDFAGNRTPSPVTVNFTRKSLNEPNGTTGYTEPVSAPGEIPVTSAESPPDSTISWFSGKDQSLGYSPGLFDIYKKKPQEFTFTAFNEYDFNYKSRIVVNPLDPKSGSDRHWTPSIMNVAQSWKKLQDLTELSLIARDPGIKAISDIPVSFPDTKDFGMSVSTGTNAIPILGNSSGYGDQIQSTLKLPHKDWTGGLRQVTYGGAVGKSSPIFIGVNYGQSAGFRWTNIVRIHPDVVATGRRVTIRIEAGFLGSSLTWPSNSATPGSGEFNLKGDYVRFVYGSEADAQEAVTKAEAALTAAQALMPSNPAAIARAQANVTAANAAKAKSDPTETAQQVFDRLQQQSTTVLPTNRISIVGQRLIAPGVNQSLQQQLELDLELGSDVLAKLFHVDIACGEVKEYDDPQARQFKASQGTPKGRDGAHRMKEALKIVKIDCVGVAEYDSDGAPSGEPVAVGRMLMCAPSPTVSIDNIACSLMPDGQISVTVGGKVSDAIADLYPRGSGADVTKVQISVGAGRPALEVALDNRDLGSRGFWRPHAFEGTFQKTVVIPYQPIFPVRIETAANMAGLQGYASTQVNIDSVEEVDASSVYNILLLNDDDRSEQRSLVTYYGMRDPINGDSILTEDGLTTDDYYRTGDQMPIPRVKITQRGVLSDGIRFIVVKVGDANGTLGAEQTLYETGQSTNHYRAAEVVRLGVDTPLFTMAPVTHSKSDPIRPYTFRVTGLDHMEDYRIKAWGTTNPLDAIGDVGYLKGGSVGFIVVVPVDSSPDKSEVLIFENGTVKRKVVVTLSATVSLENALQANGEIEQHFDVLAVNFMAIDRHGAEQGAPVTAYGSEGFDSMHLPNARVYKTGIVNLPNNGTTHVEVSIACNTTPNAADSAKLKEIREHIRFVSDGATVSVDKDRFPEGANTMKLAINSTSPQKRSSANVLAKYVDADNSETEITRLNVRAYQPIVVPKVTLFHGDTNVLNSKPKEFMTKVIDLGKNAVIDFQAYDPAFVELGDAWDLPANGGNENSLVDFYVTGASQEYEQLMNAAKGKGARPTDAILLGKTMRFVWRVVQTKSETKDGIVVDSITMEGASMFNGISGNDIARGLVRSLKSVVGGKALSIESLDGTKTFEMLSNEVGINDKTGSITFKFVGGFPAGWPSAPYAFNNAAPATSLLVIVNRNIAGLTDRTSADNPVLVVELGTPHCVYLHEFGHSVGRLRDVAVGSTEVMSYSTAPTISEFGDRVFRYEKLQVVQTASGIPVKGLLQSSWEDMNR